jgi:hypothetical protein
VRRSPSTRRAAALALILALGGTWVARDAYERGGARPLPWQDLTPRTIAAPPRAGLRVFRSASDLHAEAGRIGAARLPPIDFSRREAVLVALGPRSSSAFALEVGAVREERGRVVVTVRERSPSLARPGTASLRFPFRLISIERTGKPVTLEREGPP